MNVEEKVSAYKEMFEKIAKSVARDQPTVEWEDLSQEMMIVVLTKEDIPGPEEATAYNFFFKVAKMYASKMRAQHLTISPQYHYRQSDVRKILESSFYYSEWQNGYVPEDDPSEYRHSDSIIARADVAWAIELLDAEAQNIILGRFRDGIIPAQATPEYRKLDRALRKLTDIINSYKRPNPTDGPGSRRAISNVHAKFLIDQERDGK